MKGYPGVLSEPDMNQDKVREMFKRAVEQAPVLGRVTNLNKGKNKKSSKKRKRDTAKDVEQDDGNNGDQAPMQDEPDVQVQNLDDQTQDGEVREIPYQQMTTTLNYLFKRERVCFRELFMLYFGEEYERPATPNMDCCDLCHIWHCNTNKVALPPGLHAPLHFSIPSTSTKVTEWNLKHVDSTALKAFLTEQISALYNADPLYHTIIPFSCFCHDGLVDSMLPLIKKYGVAGDDSWLSECKWAFISNHGEALDIALKAFFVEHQPIPRTTLKVSINKTTTKTTSKITSKPTTKTISKLKTSMKKTNKDRGSPNAVTSSENASSTLNITMPINEQ